MGVTTRKTGRIVRQCGVVLGFGGLLVLGSADHWRRPVAEAHHINCGDRLDGDHELDSDVGPCPGPAPALVVDRASALDLKGFTVSCAPSTPSSIGVDLAGKRAVLRNGTVTSCFINVRASAGDHSLVNVLTSAGVIGFLVPAGSDHNRFEDTTAEDHRGGIGYLIDGSDNRLGKFTLGREKSNINTASGNAVGFFVRGDNNRLEETLALDNTVEGYTVSGKKNRFFETQAVRNPNGYSFLGNLNAAMDNTATGNIGAGIGNRGRLNDFTRNTAIGNGLDLFEATAGCGSTKWRRNSFATSQDGEAPGPVNNPSTCIE